MLTALIMAGGMGERFWPLSTPEKPKQVLDIFTGQPLIKETVNRVLTLIPIEQVFVATNQIQVETIKRLIPDLPEKNIIIEPMFKDTAAAIGYGTLYIERDFPNSTIVVLPSDHIIMHVESFTKVIEKAYDEAHHSRSIVTLGIKPTHPETGYGYIEVDKVESNEVTDVLSFREKPNFETASKYLETNRFLWNAGMFIFNINTMMEALNNHANKHYIILQKIKYSMSNLYGLELTNTVKPLFEEFNRISIDFAIMEKYDQIKVIPSDFGWSDVGDFNALKDIYNEVNSNILLGDFIVTVDASENIIIQKHPNKKTALLGVHGCIVVDTDEGLLVLDRQQTQRIKDVLKLLSTSKQ